MLTREDGAFSPLRSHLWSHHGVRSILFMAGCAVALTWWGGEAVLFPNLSGEEAIPATGAAFVPLLLGVGVLMSTIDDMADFSHTAALPRRRVLSLHLAVAFGCATTLTCLALLLSRDAATVPLALRNLLGFTGLSALSAALLGPRLAWLFPVAHTVPTFLIGSPGERGADARWWEWPRAAAENGTAWAVAVLLLVAGTGAFLRRAER
ncbi:hypothetical protein [Streptomyces chumphonensis]|uniref:hypothetical protein n=1 Tax=Streptomyces chumphonensis TaxID=1214925 RepID=UPI003D74CBC4